MTNIHFDGSTNAPQIDTAIIKPITTKGDNEFHFEKTMQLKTIITNHSTAIVIYKLSMAFSTHIPHLKPLTIRKHSSVIQL